MPIASGILSKMFVYRTKKNASLDGLMLATVPTGLSVAGPGPAENGGFLLVINNP
jgi:hypothetical protein